jgi:DNA-binding transcriptional MerR regulator
MGAPSHVDPAGQDRAAPAGAGEAEAVPADAGLRISDAAARAGVSARTLRYYEELGLLTPSGYTSGGERRYRPDDLTQLDRILELREVLGMNLEEIKGFLDSENRLEEVREAYRARKDLGTPAARAQRRALLEEALTLNEALAEQVGAKVARMNDFRSRLLTSAQRCRELLDELA